MPNPSALPGFFASAVLLVATLGVAAAAAPPATSTSPSTSTPAPAAKAPASGGSGKTTGAGKVPASPATSKSKAGIGSAGTGVGAKTGAAAGGKKGVGTKNAASAKTGASKTKPKQKPGEVMDLDWRDLLPEDERSRYSASAPPPQHGPLGEGGPPAVQKQTTTFNEDVADMVVRLPGFVVPIGTTRNGLITEFFLVPYIGACIHVPPPPSNQMVYVTSASGIAADAIHEAYWVTGKMRIESRTTVIGTSAYTVAATKVDLYEF